MTDYLVATGIIAAGLTALTGAYFKNKAVREVVPEEEYETFEDVLEAVKMYIVQQVKDESIISSLSDEELARLKKRKTRQKNALAQAPNGVRDAKMVVKGMISDWITENLTMDKIKQLVGLDGENEPPHNVMFEILMHEYRKTYGAKAFSVWMKRYGMDRPKPANGIARRGTEAYYVTISEFENSYFEENIHLTDEEITQILVTLVYERYMGWGIIDTLAEMDINGYNIGVSGSLMGGTPVQGENRNPDAVTTATNSFWVYFESHYIHLQFLDFGSLEEIRRITQLLIRWGNSGPLTTKKGYKVNTMYDKSRILAIRPDAGEAWGVFVRKFSLDIASPEALIIKEGVHGGEICAKLIEYIMLAQITVAVTGRQGSGKTTMMKAIMGYLPPDWNIRVLEMAPELYLRETYPDREIYSVQETDFVSMEALQDAFKKADATVTVIGEVATDPVAARMIQLAMTGSLMTIFSHHANTAKDLVLTIRNSLVNAGGFSNMTTAEKQVTDVLKINIHLGFEDGKRFVKRITEIKQFDEGLPYPEYDADDPGKAAFDLDREYYYRQTDRISFSTHDILTYNKDTDTYEIGECFSDYLYDRMYTAMPKEDKQGFKQFIDHYWKKKKTAGYNGVNDYDGERLPMDEFAQPEVHTNADAKRFLAERFSLTEG
jgi:pilus assembly protein CpaF